MVEHLFQDLQKMPSTRNNNNKMVSSHIVSERKGCLVCSICVAILFGKDFTFLNNSTRRVCNSCCINSGGQVGTIFHHDVIKAFEFFWMLVLLPFLIGKIFRWIALTDAFSLGKPLSTDVLQRYVEIFVHLSSPGSLYLVSHSSFNMCIICRLRNNVVRFFLEERHALAHITFRGLMG